MRVLIATACLVAVLACFKPRVEDGGYQCNPMDDSCPPGFSCRACDHHCWRDPNVPCGPIDAAVVDQVGSPVDARFDGPAVVDSSTADTRDGPLVTTCNTNTFCEPDLGENCLTCPADCGVCACSAAAFCDVCLGDNCVNCPTKCGICPTNCGSTTGMCTTGTQCTNCPLTCSSGCPPTGPPCRD